ncbi:MULTISPECIES: hypothetical protein [unclassified Janibacter]|uniref:hypothetical protein n=1 Tax=unclassified Janibacter TaxID=2649294 RepID=UPI003D0191E0
MTRVAASRANLIWATRGRSWGFRFLLDAGLSDPLDEYERVFAELADETVAWRRTDRSVAVRFLDPNDRRDSAGRIIPHEFVVLGDGAELIGSVEDGKEHLWPLVESAFQQVWDAETAPSPADLHFE